MTTDLTFFTNEPDAALLDRFKATLSDVQFFDVLVGYFRTSGFHLLSDALTGIEEIRILIGLGVDRQALEIVEASGQQLELAFQSSRQTKDLFADEVVDEMERSADTYDTERGVRTFVQWLQSGKLKLKAHPSHQIHAKVYISRFPSHDRDFGRVITGSSNFSYSGLLGNYEFNVELKDAADVRFALAKFEELWAEAVDISDAYLDRPNRIRALQKALEYEPHNTIARHSLGVALSQSGNFDQALQIFDDIINDELRRPEGPSESIAYALKTKVITLQRASRTIAANAALAEAREVLMKYSHLQHLVRNLEDLS